VARWIQEASDHEALLAPGACSLASRISLHEAGIAADFERVDMKPKITDRGFDYNAINPKGYVPMLVLDDGTAITENTAILEFIADREPKLAPGGLLGRTRLIETLSDRVRSRWSPPTARPVTSPRFRRPSRK
jgi:glutathione S-transferase